MALEKKTLVIHPKDLTTDCLAVIYEGRDWTVVRNPATTHEKIRDLILAHDRIIMLGHGTPWGLLASKGANRFGRYILDTSFLTLLKEKETYSVWCNSDEFFKKGNIPGFHTGMIISEVGEEWAMLGKAPLDEEEMNSNMELFCGLCAKYIDSTPEEMKKGLLREYVGKDAVTQYNRKNIIVL